MHSEQSRNKRSSILDSRITTPTIQLLTLSLDRPVVPDLLFFVPAFLAILCSDVLEIYNKIPNTPTRGGFYYVIVVVPGWGWLDLMLGGDGMEVIVLRCIWYSLLCFSPSTFTSFCCLLPF